MEIFNIWIMISFFISAPTANILFAPAGSVYIPSLNFFPQYGQCSYGIQ